MVDVAQLVRASDCDSEGRGFESPYPPLKKPSRNQFSARFFLLGHPPQVELQGTKAMSMIAKGNVRQNMAASLGCWLLPTTKTCRNTMIHPFT